jgi:hypothetical protein
MLSQTDNVMYYGRLAGIAVLVLMFLLWSGRFQPTA